MSAQIGEDIRVKATNESGQFTATNGHALKLGGKWFHMDELEVVKEDVGAVCINGDQRNYIVVMVPDVVPLMSPLGLEEEVCIGEVTAHAAWLASRPFVDASALVFGGFSAGGAAALEVAADLQEKGVIRPAALALLDPVPWTRTAVAAERLQALPRGILVLLSEPSVYNNFGAFQKDVAPHLEAKSSLSQDLSQFQAGDLVMLTVNDARHVDAESANTPSAKAANAAAPASLLRGIFDLVSAPANKERAHTFYLLVEAFLSDVLCAASPSYNAEMSQQASGTMLATLRKKLEIEVRIDVQQKDAEPMMGSITQTLGNMFLEAASEKRSKEAGCPTQ